MNLTFFLFFILNFASSALSADARQPYQILLEEEFNPTVNEVIIQGIQKYNLPFFKQSDLQFFVVYARNEQSEVIGGLCGDILGTCACVDYMWVDEKQRGQGIGSKLFAKLENFAKSKKCTSIQLFTYDFQAEKFYKKLGFQSIGIVPKWIEDHDTIFLRKMLK
jgi:GNAT superfamily N-acetyltransferase